jgi:hypothetical protein
MATIRILLGVVWLVTFGGSRGIERDRLIHDLNDGAYRRIVDAARKETGVREGNVPNTGPKVSEYLHYVGINHPAPWCAAWVSYVFGQAGYNAPKTAWSPDLFPAKRSLKAPRSGFVLGIYFPALKRIAHCGIVEQVKDDLVYSIEGNTNGNGSREGDGVYRRIRHKRSIHRYSDWTKH